MLQQRLIVGVRAAQAFDEAADGRRVWFVETIFFQIQIVNDPADPADARIGEAEARTERLERTTALVVAELGVERIEGDGAGGRGPIAELERRGRIDEAADEPRRRHAVDTGTRPCEPDAAAVVGQVERRGRR